jgi:hypothetical protein
MMKNIFAVAAMLIFAGCVSYSYTGKYDTPVKEEKDMRIFTDPAKITRKYTVLGKATVSGNCQDVSRDRLVARLKSEAHDAGASAIIITDQQVVTESEDSGSSPFFTAFDADDTNSNWSQLQQDVDENFANTRRMKNVTSPGASRRIIHAEFIRYAE